MDDIAVGDLVEFDFFTERYVGEVAQISGWYVTVVTDHGGYVVRIPDLIRRLDVLPS